MRILFTLATLLGSFLLFVVEPMAARAILPAYGGAPAVWNACLLTFQLLLLAGYGWAHLAGRLRAPHLALLTVGAGAALIYGRAWATTGSANLPAPFAGLPPVLGVGLTLAGMVGLPFVALSAGSSILQRWFSRTADPAARDPYFLYAASNVGSLAALLAYPLFVEPRFGLSAGFAGWSYGVVGLALLVGMCAGLGRPLTAPSAKEYSGGGGTPPPRGLWVLLSAVPSALLMGVTGFVTTNVAPMPLLWVVPLALYLLTFILAFSPRVRLSSAALGRFLPLLAAPLAILVVLESTDPRGPVALMHGVVFFLASWMCHRRLAELRPPAEGLTRFFLYVSVGGALGGAFVAVIAPMVFPVQFEYPLALCLALALRPAIKASPLKRDGLIAAGITLVAVVCISLAIRLEPGFGRTALAVGAPVALAFWTMDFPLRFAGSLLGIFAAAAALAPAAAGRLIFTERSFFGVHRVLARDGGRVRELVHGATTHGIQDRRQPGLPLTYYHPTGPAGQVFKILSPERHDVALVGLGVGSLAAYGRPGDRYTVFEIDPAVLDIARDRGLFTFLKDSKAAIRYREGDARLTLAEEPDAAYDLLALDTFTGDSVPTHLLTAEAGRMYARKVKPGGALLIHISNRFLELEPVVLGMAWAMGWRAATQEDGATVEEEAAGKTQSRWMILARNEAELKSWTGLYWNADDGSVVPRPWTDDRSDLLSSVKAAGE